MFFVFFHGTATLSVKPSAQHALTHTGRLSVTPADRPALPLSGACKQPNSPRRRSQQGPLASLHAGFSLPLGLLSPASVLSHTSFEYRSVSPATFSQGGVGGPRWKRSHAHKQVPPEDPEEIICLRLWHLPPPPPPKYTNLTKPLKSN